MSAPAVYPLRDVVLFQFLDETGGSKGRFHDRVTGSGIILASSVSSQKVHRWGRVYAVGPDVKDDLKPGDFILIEALMWVEGIKLDADTKIWKTDPSKVLLVTTDINETYRQ